MTSTVHPAAHGHSAQGLLREVQRLPTSGARAVEPFSHQGEHYLAVPQLALDVAGQPASMTQGNSDTDLIVYRWSAEQSAEQFIEHQRLAVPGGEDAEVFSIGQRLFMATASLRAGSGPYEMDVRSTVYEMRGDRFEPFQSFSTFAAKQWTHFAIGQQHYLALAQGAPLPGMEGRNRRSQIYQWVGDGFELLQDIPSAWGYNWLHLQVGGEHLLAYADHAEPSRLLRWNGRLFEPFQQLPGKTGRAFCAFAADDQQWLAFASLHDETRLLRWDGQQFAMHQALSGPGGREFEWLPGSTADAPGHLVQINFILGTREAPLPAMQSAIHAWRDGKLELVDTFPTTGGTDAAAFTVGGRRMLAVSNSLGADVRLRADTLIYEVSGD